MTGTSSRPDLAVVVLGRQVARLAQSHTALDGQVGDLAKLLRELALDVATLAARCAPDGDDESVRSWLLTEDPKLAQVDLVDLVEWLGRVYLRYPDAVLPSCWLWHPEVIEELRWLRCAHREAYHAKDGTWQQVGDWHDRQRPGVVARINRYAGNCELHEHADGGGQRRRVPLTDAVPDIAWAWTTTADSPVIPSELQVHRAERHDDGASGPGKTVRRG